MTTEEKKIEEAAYALAKDPNGAMRYSNAIYNACVLMAKSDATKEYHTKGMYSKDQVFKLLKELQYDYHNHQHSEGMFDLKQWFNDKTK